MPSTHPDFPDNTEVINVKKNSAFFGQRGIVYGSGPSKSDTSSHAVLFVRWPNGERFKYFPKRLAPAPLKESMYKVSGRTRGKTKTQVHDVPATKSRPTIFDMVPAQRHET